MLSSHTGSLRGAHWTRPGTYIYRHLPINQSVCVCHSTSQRGSQVESSRREICLGLSSLGVLMQVCIHHTHVVITYLCLLHDLRLALG